jgi:hypothetical protein
LKLTDMSLEVHGFGEFWFEAVTMSDGVPSASVLVSPVTKRS